jgi:hypothetical protein
VRLRMLERPANRSKTFESTVLSGAGPISSLRSGAPALKGHTSSASRASAAFTSDQAEVEVPPFKAGEKVCFTYGFFRDCLLKRMTTTQFESLERSAALATGEAQEEEEEPTTELIYPGSVKEAYINKRGGARLAWKKRFCVLYPDRLEYHKKKGDRQACGSIPIYPDTQILTDEYKDHTFGLIPEPVDYAREYVIKVKPDSEAKAWIAAIQEQIAMQTSNVLSGLLRTERRQDYGDDSD